MRAIGNPAAPGAQLAIIMSVDGTAGASVSSQSTSGSAQSMTGAGGAVTACGGLPMAFRIVLM
jgi:hypothetical protein